ncbi:MAG: TonB-dependent receptor [Gemmatimonadetes bacterium]|nr:TonB-dependent receptor [Gemmatimonadota bacterium]
MLSSFLLATALLLPGGAVTGRVTAEGGAPVVEARVSLVELGRQARTDVGGRFQFPGIPSGSYTLSVSAIGFKPVLRRVVVADADQVINLTLTESLVELPPIQVTSTPSATDPLSSPQPTAVVDGENLHAAQAPSLGETLNQVAGVHSLSTGAGIGKPVIRGLTSNRVLILDEGQRMETQQWGDEHGPNIETAMADRIEVIRGPASVLYGSDALGGVVNIIPRPLPSAEPGTTQVGGELTATYRSNTREPDGAFLLEAARGNLGVRATLSGRAGDDVRTPDYRLWNSGNRALGGTLAVGTRGGWGGITATVSRRDEKVELTDEDPAATPFQRIGTTRLRVDGDLPLGASRLELKLGAERNRRREFEASGDTEAALELLSRNYTADALLHHTVFGQLRGIVGVSGLRTEFDKAGEETLIPNTDVTGLGVYAFEQVTLGRLDLSVGARYDYRYLAVRDTTLPVDQDRTWNSLTGNLGLLYRVAEPVAVVFNVGRGFRAPSSFDLFSNGVHEGTVAFERGNAGLATEKSLNTDLALRLQTARAAVELGGFVNWVEDFIYTVPTGQTDPGSGFQIYDVTQGNARLSGVELAGQVHPTRWLHLQGTADYVRGTNTSTGNPLPAMPPFRVTWNVRLETAGRGYISEPYLLFSGESHARQGRLDPAEASFFADAFGGKGYRSAAYSLVNLGGGFSLGPSPKALHVDLVVRNLFNTAYADFLSRLKTNAENPGIGRNVVLRLSSRF